MNFFSSGMYSIKQIDVPAEQLTVYFSLNVPDKNFYFARAEYSVKSLWEFSKHRRERKPVDVQLFHTFLNTSNSIF